MTLELELRERECADLQAISGLHGMLQRKIRVDARTSEAHCVSWCMGYHSSYGSKKPRAAIVGLPKGAAGEMGPLEEFCPEFSIKKGPERPAQNLAGRSYPGRAQGWGN